MSRGLWWACAAILAGCSSGHATTTTSTGSSGGASSATSSSAGGSGPCGSRSGHRGLTTRSRMVAGQNRTYLVYLPASLDATKPMPFVFVHHGYTMSGQAMHDITGYAALADSEGFGVAFPDGEAGPDAFAPPWNVGSNVCPSSVGPPPQAAGDDFAFLDAMESDVSQDQCLDKAHIFLTGFSMGGYFAHQVACLRPDIRSVAPHSGGTHDLGSCTTGHKPIMIFHGKSDSLIYDGCDDPKASGASVPPGSVTPSATAWAMRNGCSMQTTSTPVMGGTCDYYVGCPADGQVAICTFDNMGHCWAGGASNGGTFSCPNYESATKLEWDFWKKYAW